MKPQQSTLVCASMALLVGAASAQTSTAVPAPRPANSVEIYGVFDIYAANQKNASSTAASTTTKVLNPGGLTTSFIGFRGTEDLGGGLRALFVIESYIRPDLGATGRNDTDAFWGRASWIAVEGGFGRVSAGRMPTPYSLASTNFTPFLGTTGLSPIFANIFRNNVQGDTRFVNALRYSSPKLSGFDLEAMYSLGQEISSGANSGRDRAFDGHVRYVQGALSAIVSTRQINLNNASDGHDQRAWMGGITYDFGVAKLTAQYHDGKETFNAAARNVNRKTYEVGATVPVGGRGRILAEVAGTRIDDLSATTSDRRQSWALGYLHELSKRTELYALAYSDTLKNPAVKQQTLALGIRHRF